MNFQQLKVHLYIHGLFGEVQLLHVCHCWNMLENQGLRMEHCLWRLLVQMLQLVLDWVWPWFALSWETGSLVWFFLTHHWRSGKTVMIFPVVFHHGLRIATVSPVFNGPRLWVYLLYFSAILASLWWSIFSRHCATTIHLGCGLYRVSCEAMEPRSWQWRRNCAGNSPVSLIGIFGYCRMSELHCHCPKNLGCLNFRSVSSL